MESLRAFLCLHPEAPSFTYVYSKKAGAPAVTRGTGRIFSAILRFCLSSDRTGSLVFPDALSFRFRSRCKSLSLFLSLEKPPYDFKILIG